MNVTLFGKEGLWRGNKVKDIVMRSFWIFLTSPRSNDSILLSMQQITQTGRRPCEDRDYSDVTTSQGMPRTDRGHQLLQARREARDRFAPKTSGRNHPADNLMLDAWLPAGRGSVPAHDITGSWCLSELRTLLTSSVSLVPQLPVTLTMRPLTS